jgi:hypothetical protein
MSVSCPARPDGTPIRVEHEYVRSGALNLLASFDTRTGEVIGICRRRKRQEEFIELLEAIEQQTPSQITLIHLICDNLRVHKGKKVCAWLQKHPRFRMHFTPVHCSWMNQVEQWFSIPPKCMDQPARAAHNGRRDARFFASIRRPQ